MSTVLALEFVTISVKPIPLHLPRLFQCIRLAAIRTQDPQILPHQQDNDQHHKKGHEPIQIVLDEYEGRFLPEQTGNPTADQEQNYD
jgi:hypothetical protein